MTNGQLKSLSWSGVDQADETLSFVDSWLASQAILGLVEAFGGRLQSSDKASLSRELYAFSGSHWDFRDGSERDQAVDAKLDSLRSSAVLEAAEALGLMKTIPPSRGRYDAILMLGGLVRACVVRPRYVAQLIGQGLQAREFVGLSAFRSLGEKEARLARELGVSQLSEYAAMMDGVKLAFSDTIIEEARVTGERHPEDPNRSWEVTTWRSSRLDPENPSSTAEFRVVAAPSSEPAKRRTNTTDTYMFWEDQIRKPELNSVLLVTSPAYAIYQGSLAIKHLGIDSGLEVETVGVTPSAADLGTQSHTWTAQDYLQEIHSSIGALVGLRGSLETLLR